MLNHSGTKTIETNRTIMRKFKLDDAEDMFNNWASDEQVTRYLTWQHHKTLKVSQDVMETWCAHYNQNTYHWALVLKESNELIGTVGLVRINEKDKVGEFGYAIARKYWNKGIVTEAMNALFEYFFNEIGFEKIEGLHDVDNTASGRVMQKLGMSFVGRISDKYKDNKGNDIDVSRYTIDKKTFNSIKIRKAYSHEIDDIAKLYFDLVSYMDSTKNYPGWKNGIYPTLKVAEAGFAEDSLYVATIASKIVGSCVLNNKQPEPYKTAKWECKTDKPLVVHTLCVNPNFQKQGIAQKLLNFVDELAIDKGIHSIRLDTSEPNIPAIKLYEKVGYKHVGNVDLLINRGGIKCWYTFEKIV